MADYDVLLFDVLGVLAEDSETITRAVLIHEIPIGVLTALIGGPVFCWIFKKTHQNKGGL